MTRNPSCRVRIAPSAPSTASTIHSRQRVRWPTTSDSLPDSRATGRSPASGIVIGMLVGNHARVPGFVRQFLVLGLFGQIGQPAEIAALAVGVDLNRRRRLFRIVQRPDGDLYPAFELVSQQCAAGGAEAPSVALRALKDRSFAARPFHIMGGHKRCEQAAEDLLAHAAMAGRSPAEPADGIANGAVLTAAGYPVSFHCFASLRAKANRPRNRMMVPNVKAVARAKIAHRVKRPS